jgi:hypothetical protein
MLKGEIMKRRIIWIGAGAVALVLAPWLVGCEGTGGKGHEMTAAQKADQVLGCQSCYDETIRVRRSHAKGSGFTRNQTIKKHMCPDCNGEMSTYTKDGKLMIKCANCAPEGVACDRCLPPESGS